MTKKIKKVTIKYKENGDLEEIQIGGDKFKENDGLSWPNEPTEGLVRVDRIVITEGSTCVWRNGRKYCA